MRLCKHEQILYCLNTENEKLECPYCELEVHYYIWSKVYASFIEKKKTKKHKQTGLTISSFWFISYFTDTQIHQTLRNSNSPPLKHPTTASRKQTNKKSSLQRSSSKDSVICEEKNKIIVIITVFSKLSCFQHHAWRGNWQILKQCSL